MTNNKKKPHQTQSFEQMVGETTLKRLEPYIQQQVAQASQQVVQSVYQAMMNERSMIQTRQLAFERLLKPWFNEEVLALAVADVEDESAGFLAVEDAAKQGDKVRLSFKSKFLDEGDWSDLNKLAIHSLGTKGPGGNVQTLDALESSLVGMKTGETKELLIPEQPEEGHETKNTRVEVTLIRVSRAKAAANG